jgi:hypothetical protein
MAPDAAVSSAGKTGDAAAETAEDELHRRNASAVGDGESAPSEAEVLPELNDSDSWVRSKLVGVALPWLSETELLRTSATVLESASRGEVPRKFVAFLAPEGRFAVRKMGTLIQVDPESYERYTPFVKALERLPPERAADLFRVAEPLLAEAIRELGETRVSPRELAYTALGVALDTPRVDSSTVLKQPKVFYTYADERLESLKPLQKQLLRMGPDNLHTVRLWLEDFGLALSPASMSSDSVDADKGSATDRVGNSG